jgi:hypothetical protein
MKHAVSVSLGSSKRDKSVKVRFKNEEVLVERFGTDGDIEKAHKMYLELDGKIDALGVGGVDLYLRLDGRDYPLRAALKLVRGVKTTPLVDGRGLKHTLERRVFELAHDQLDQDFHFKQAFVPVAIDRIGLAQAAAEVSDSIVLGDLMVALGIPLPVYGIPAFKRLARILLPIVSWFPMSMIFYGSSGAEQEPKYSKYFESSDLLAGDYLFMRKYMPLDISGKTIITNTTTSDNIELLRTRGAKMIITTTPRYEGRSFGTNMLEAALTAYAGKGRPLTEKELNSLINELELRPTVINF